jgi:hypothetical protein
MKKKIFFYILLIISIYFIAGYTINKNIFSSLRSYVSNENKFLIKKYFFPHKYISQLEKEILRNKSRSDIHNVFFAVKKEINFKKSLNDFKTKKKIKKILSNDSVLFKYSLSHVFLTGINHTIPGSGYIDFHNNDLFILSARGILGYSANIGDEIIFKQIQNNLNNFIGLNQFYKGNWFSFKDLLIHNNTIFVSFTEEIKKNCWNTSVVYGKLNYEDIKFNKLFTNDSCINSHDNIDKEFNAHQSGGRMIGFDNDHILLSTGDYRSRFLSQNKKSNNGKIIKINLNSKSTKLVSMGHRNPQGLYLDKKNKFILETEHGPKGGDEINLINLVELNNKNIPNFGWPIASAGEHYKDPNGDKYKKYPLYKSHSKYGFIEPLKSFVPSIGISEIVKISEKEYAVGSLKERAIYFFELDSEKQITNLKKVKIFERIRDLKFYNNKLYLLLEDTASIGIISFE